MKKKITGVKKIAVLRALQLGDMLCAVPAFRALRHAYPEAEITLLGLPWAENFVQRFSGYFDRFIHFPGYPGLPEQSFDENTWLRFVQQVQEEQFDLVLQMQGNGTIVNELLPQFHPLYSAGFQNKESYVNDHLFLEYPDYGSEVQRHLLLMQHLGIRPAGEQLEFPLTGTDYEERESLLLALRRKSYVCVHAGSRESWRQWPPNHFAMMADYCNSNGFIAVLTGSKNEKDITREVRKCLLQPCIDLTGFTSLGCLAVVLKDARLLISNCTGVSHLAAAVGTPGIIISMDGEPERWGHSIHTMIDWTNKPSLQKVLDSTNELLSSERPAVM